MELVALLPWWAGVGLALLLYLGLHHVAQQPAPVLRGDPTFISQMLWRSLAGAGQYLLPGLCLVSAGVSWFGRRQRQALVANVSANPTADALQGMSWQAFEQLVGEIFRQQGFQVLETGGGGPDGGVDLVLWRDGETHLVQCKQWRAFRVGVDVVRAHYGVMAARGAASGFVVTSGRFTDEARAFAEGRHVRLIDGPRLLGLIQQVQSAASPTPPVTATTPIQPTPPACPRCGQVMVRRVAQRGANAGKAFWGCTGYPACRGTLPLD